MIDKYDAQVTVRLYTRQIERMDSLRGRISRSAFVRDILIKGMSSYQQSWKEPEYLNGRRHTTAKKMGAAMNITPASAAKILRQLGWTLRGSKSNKTFTRPERREKKNE